VKGSRGQGAERDKRCYARRSVVITALALVPLSIAGAACSGSKYGAVSTATLPTVPVPASSGPSDPIFSEARTAIADGLRAESAAVNGLQGPSTTELAQALAAEGQNVLQAAAFEAAQQAGRIAARNATLGRERTHQALVAARLAAAQAARARALAAREAARAAAQRTLLAARAQARAAAQAAQAAARAQAQAAAEAARAQARAAAQALTARTVNSSDPGSISYQYVRPNLIPAPSVRTMTDEHDRDRLEHDGKVPPQ